MPLVQNWLTQLNICLEALQKKRRKIEQTVRDTLTAELKDARQSKIDQIESFEVYVRDTQAKDTGFQKVRSLEDVLF